MIYDTLVWACVAVIGIAAVFSYMKYSARLDSETQIQKANAYASAQLGSARAEFGAFQYGQDEPQGGGLLGGLGEVGQIVQLMSDPTVRALIEKFKEKKS